MHAIDLRTSLILTALMCGVMGVVLLAAYRHYPRSIGGLREWAVGAFAFAGAGPLFALRGLIGEFIGIVLANGLYIVGYALLWKGLCQLLKRPTWSWRMLSIGVVVSLALVCFWTYLVPSIAARSLLMAGISSLTYVALLLAVWQHARNNSFSPALWFFIIANCCGLAGTLTRFVGTLLQPDSSAMMQPSVPQAIYVFSYSFMAVLHFLSFFLLATEHLHQQLIDMAHSDPLTGALNRRGLNERLPGELADLKRKHRAIAMVLCDLDHFKTINDRYGHDVGDAVLVHFSGMINSLKRPRDLCVRLGGEEFALILTEAGLEQAMGVAQRLHEHLGQVRHDAIPAYTSSFGVAGIEAEQLLTEDVQTLTEDWFRRADMAVYRAKTAGRNCIEAG